MASLATLTHIKRRAASALTAAPVSVSTETQQVYIAAAISKAAASVSAATTTLTPAALPHAVQLTVQPRVDTGQYSTAAGLNAACNYMCASVSASS